MTLPLEFPYAQSREHYAAVGVDTETALQTLAGIPISLHCWQGDDVGGFETPGATLGGGGIQATATTRARRGRSRNCAPTSNRPSRSSPAATA